MACFACAGWLCKIILQIKVIYCMGAFEMVKYNLGAKKSMVQRFLTVNKMEWLTS